LYRITTKIRIQILLFIASFFLQIRDEESCQVFLKEEEETKHFVPGSVPLIKEELLFER
jgi:hypothetical protein